jgi:hypothetical protein
MFLANHDTAENVALYKRLMPTDSSGPSVRR